MKLYTEEQVREMLQVCQDSDLYEDILTFDDILKTQISIELPSDEEIEKNGYHESDYDKIWKEGAKWMKQQILNQNK